MSCCSLKTIDFLSVLRFTQLIGLYTFELDLLLVSLEQISMSGLW